VINQDGRPTIIDTPLTRIFKVGQVAFLFLSCQSKQQMIWLWLSATFCTPYYPRYMTKNLWRSVDAHDQNGAGRVSYSILPVKVANNSFMTAYNLSAVRLPRTNDQYSLTLHGRSFSRWGMNLVDMIFTNKGCQYFDYAWLQRNKLWITWPSWTIIDDSPLTHILPGMHPNYAIIRIGVVLHSHVPAAFLAF